MAKKEVWSPPVQVCIPEIGTRWILNKDWSFRLYDEYRNSSLFEILGIKMSQRWGRDPKKHLVTIPAGLELTVDRVYIRTDKGVNNPDGKYNSLTFRITGATTPKSKNFIKNGKRLRFWAKLADVNKMVVYIAEKKIEEIEPNPDALTGYELAKGDIVTIDFSAVQGVRMGWRNWNKSKCKRLMIVVHVGQKYVRVAEINRRNYCDIHTIPIDLRAFVRGKKFKVWREWFDSKVKQIEKEQKSIGKRPHYNWNDTVIKRTINQRVSQLESRIIDILNSTYTQG